MPDITRPRPKATLRRPAAALIAGLLLVTLGGGATLAQDASAPPPDPGTDAPSSSVPSLEPAVYDSNAIPAAPMPGIVDPAPVGWDHVTIWPDGQTLTVYFWNGAEPCYGLARVELVDVDGTLSITLWTGFRADAAAIRCVAVEQLYSTVVTLGSPILGGGLPGLSGEQAIAGDAMVLLPGASLSTMEPHPWDRVDVGPDGRSWWVYLIGGVDPCFGLGRVELVDQGGLDTLVLSTGPLVSAGDGVCPAMAFVYRTPVLVETPILLGGLS